MKTFTYESQLYIRVIPAKSLFNSSLVHQVVNRGDIFAVRVSDSTLTIIPGKATVEHTEHDLTPISTSKQTTAASIATKAGTARANARLVSKAELAQRALFGNL